MLADMGMQDVFDSELGVPAIGSIGSLLRVVEEAGLFASSAHSGGMTRLRQLLESAGLSDDYAFTIGVKRLLALVEFSRQDQDPAETLFSRVSAQIGAA